MHIHDILHIYIALLGILCYNIGIALTGSVEANLLVNRLYSLVERFMSLHDLQALEFPKIGSDQFLDNIYKKYLLLLRIVKKASKRMSSKTALYFRSQYYVSSATSDLKKATVHNEDIVITSSIISIILMFCYIKMAGEMLFLFLLTAYEFAEATNFNMIVLFIVVISVFAVIAGWLAAFIMNTLAISIMEGATRKQYKSIRSTLRKSLKYTSRVTCAWLAYLAVIGLPQVAIAIMTFIFITIGPNPLEALTSVMPLIAVASITSAVLLIMNYGLVPYVALFENSIPLSRTFQRSRQLVKTKGRIFILGIYGILTTALITAYFVSKIIENLIYIPNVFTFFVLASAIAFYSHCLTVMLYRKRKLARR